MDREFMNRKVIIILGVLLVLLLMIFGYVLQKSGLISGKIGFKTYRSSDYGLAFDYPRNYFLEKKLIENNGLGFYLLSLTEDTEENRLVREGEAPGRDGPVSIEVKIYENTNPKKAILEWIQTTEEANFKLSNGKYEFINIDGERGIRFHWSGLYEADSWVVGHKGKIVSFTVQYISPEDQIFRDFEKFIEGIRFF